MSGEHIGDIPENSAIDHDKQALHRHQELLLKRIEKLEREVHLLKVATGQPIPHQYTPARHEATCGGIHKPFDEIVWPDHCHTRRCPRCGRDYPI